MIHLARFTSPELRAVSNTAPFPELLSGDVPLKRERAWTPATGNTRWGKGGYLDESYFKAEEPRVSAA